MTADRAPAARMPPRAATLLALLLAAGTAQAGSVSWQGYVDLRWVDAASERSWVDGGLGKTRWGGDGGLHFGGAALALSWQATPTLLAFVEVQAQADMDPQVDLTVAFLRWRPVSTTPWRWSLKAGAMFPPVSLENDGIGWTSRWTLTPSAINSWVGEELRHLGAEARVEHRGERGTFEAALGLFGLNEPAGELLATRGWALGDHTTGWNGWLRQPDVHAADARTSAPFGFSPFQRIDGDIGGYVQLRWTNARAGDFSLLRYDNRADPAAFRPFADRRLFAWHTRFTALGWQHRFGDLRLVAQAMHGGTAFEPAPGRYMDSRFASAFLLAAWERGDWRPALRLENFRVRQTNSSDPLDEDGHALTVALNWRPHEQLRLTGEWVRVWSERPQRGLGGGAARQADGQVQVSLRWVF